MAVADRLDPADLEQRTQAIGRELFAAAQQASTHLSVFNRWSGQVLSWCLGDAAVRNAVLRFIDVLPSLEDPRVVARHVAEYFSHPELRLPAALRMSAAAARSGLVTAPVLAATVRQMVEQVARQFIAQAGPDGSREVIARLALRHAATSFDVLGEQVLSEGEADRYIQQYHRVLADVSAGYAALPTPPPSCGPLVNLSVKPSALTARFDSISPEDAIARAARRLLPLLQQAHAHQALVTLDMEQHELHDLTLALAQHTLLDRTVGPRASLGIVLQAYLRDTDATLERLLEWLIRHERALTVRLVRGAYWDFEVAQAAQRHWPVPVYQRKAETDAAFERLTRRLLSAHPLITTAIASHNVRSVAHAMAVAETLGLGRDQLEFQMLYGMGDALHTAVAARGYPVRIYTPVGELIPGMAYLVRRLLENTANDSFLRQEFLRERTAEQLLTPPMPPLAARAGTDERRAGEPHTAHGGCEWSGEPFADFSRASAREGFTAALETVRGQLGQTYPALLGDRAIGETEPLTVRNPAHPSQVIGRVATASLGHVNMAVAQAAAAQPAWAARPAEERAACLRRAAALMRQQRQVLAAWEVLEVGKPWREAEADVMEAIEYLEYYALGAQALAAGRVLPQPLGERNRYVYQPRGIAVVIAPWNFPSAILTGMASAALATGNAVLLKPAEQSPIMAVHIVRMFRQAGIPPAVIQLLPGYGPEVGAALVRHPGTHVTLFTGSRAVGLAILHASVQVGAGQRFIKHVVAELGGKNAIVVDDDADLDAAVSGTVLSAFGYAGQKCSAASRVIVHARVYDRFLARLFEATDRLVVGDPADPAVDLGPVIEEAAQRRLLDALAQAKEVARVAYRYPQARLPEGPGYYVPPAIITDIPPQHPLAREELFGPLLGVFRANSFADGLALANDTDYALTGGVYSRSPSHLERAIQQLDVGNLYLNRPITGALVGRQPFGGRRLSGLGTKAGGPDYLLQLVVPKTITENTSRHGMPLE